MFLKKKRFNTLSDIKKHIILTPLVFVLIIATFSVVVVSLVLDYKKSNQIELLIQKDKYQKRNILRSYISDVKYNSSASFDDIEEKLNRSVFEISGHIQALQSNNHKVEFKDIKKALIDLENKRDIDFVVFNSNSFEVLRGANIVSYLQSLTNSKMKTDYFRVHMLRNIIYMGDENLIYWLDNQKRDIRLSYFQKIESKNWVIGAFSKIDDMKALTRKTIENSIVSKSKAYENSYFWFYDYENAYVYNYYNKGHKISKENLIKEDRVNFSRFLKKESLEQNDDIYNFAKYQFLVAVKKF